MCGMYSWGSKLIDFESAFQVRNTCILGEINEIGLVQEFDKLENRYRTLNEETVEHERQFLNICEKFQAERENWKQEQIR